MNFSKIIDRVGRQSVRKVEFIALHDFVDLGSLPLHDAREHRNVRRETEERVIPEVRATTRRPTGRNVAGWTPPQNSSTDGSTWTGSCF